MLARDAEAILWVDITGCHWYRTDLATFDTVSYAVPSTIGAIAQRRSGGIVAAVAEGYATLSLTGDYHLAISFLPAADRMNDANCDSNGRFWAGSTATDFARGRGMLHVLRPDWTIETVLDGLTLPNGLDWSPDDSEFYLVDSIERVVYAYNFDLDRGTIRDQRVLYAFADDDDAMPDGLTVDKRGNLWIAAYGGHRFDVVAPSGRRIGSIPVPVKYPTSCALGPSGDIWVTSARGAGDPLEGALLTSSLPGCLGTPSNLFNG